MSNNNTASPQSTQTTEPPAGRWFNSEGGYFQLPRALRFDERLSHTQRVVLMTIASHVIHCDEVFPSREAIRSYTGMDAADITAHTNALEDLGWLSKSHTEGLSVRYLLHVPRYAVERMHAMKLEAEVEREFARERRLAARDARMAARADKAA